MSAETPAAVYEAVYRDTPFAAIGLLSVLGSALAAGVYVALRVPSGGAFAYMAEIAAANFALAGLVTLFSLRKHRWTIKRRGLIVEERPYARYCGFGRRAVLPFDAIVALRRIESGFDSQMEIESRSGRTYRMSPAKITLPAGTRAADADGFEALDAILRKRFKSLGDRAPLYQDGLGFWNKIPGLSVLWFGFAATLALSAVILWGMMEGFHMPQGMAMQGLALVFVLPVFTGYALLTALRRRWSVFWRRAFVASAKKTA